MTVNWQGYEPCAFGFVGSMNDLPRKEAREAFDRMMAARPERIEALRSLLAQNGVGLTDDQAGVQALNDWVASHVEADPEHPGLLTPLWYSIVFDSGMFLGNMLIERHPHLHWEFLDRRPKDIGFQRPVIVGFAQVANRSYYVDFWHTVSVYAKSVISYHGSRAELGTVNVRGMELDLDEIVSAMPQRLPPADAFWSWMIQEDHNA